MLDLEGRQLGLSYSTSPEPGEGLLPWSPSQGQPEQQKSSTICSSQLCAGGALTVLGLCGSCGASREQGGPLCAKGEGVFLTLVAWKQQQREPEQPQQG